MKNILDYIIPVVIGAFTIIMFVIGFFIFSYILIFAAIVGFVLFLFAYFRAKWLMAKIARMNKKENPAHNKPAGPAHSRKNAGRTIDHNE